MTSRKGRQNRRITLEGRKAEIRQMTEEQLRALSNELGQEIDRLSKEITTTRAVLDYVKNERIHRTKVGPNGFTISDHACVRYLERVKGIDMKAIRTEIEAMAIKAKAKYHGDYGVSIAENGLALGINSNTKVVATIYKPDEIPNEETKPGD